RGLNDGEAVNSASRALFVGQRGEFRDRAYQDQVHRASCLHLLVAAIGAWTTPYLADAIAALRAEGEDVRDELIAHLSPIAWKPVNFLGQFTFDPGNARPLDDRRPLRSGAVDTGRSCLAGVFPQKMSAPQPRQGPPPRRSDRGRCSPGWRLASSWR